jgi:hypothetical protein
VSGFGRAFDAAQARYDNMAPPEPTPLDDLAAEVADIIELCEETIGRAQRALEAGQLDAARDLLIEAGRELAENAVAAWERTE